MTQIPDHMEALTGSVEAFLAKGSHQQRSRSQRGRLPAYDRQFWRELSAMGLLGILIPETHGGQGLGLREAATVAQLLSRHLVPEPYTAVSVMAATALIHGDGGMRDKLLQGIAAGSLIPALAWQESLNQSDPEAISTTVLASADGLAISGEKRFVVPGAGADGYLVSAKSPEGLALYWVPLQSPGLSVAEEVLSDGSFFATLQLSNVRVRPEHQIASPGTAKAALEAAIHRGMISAGAELCGIAGSAFHDTVEYLKVRTQFGKPIGSFQALQHRAVDCYIQLRLALGVLQDALEMEDADPSQLAMIANRVKARCGHAANLIIKEAIQMHGAMGFTDACDVSLYVKRTMVLSVWLGNETGHRRQFARIAGNPSAETPRGGTAVKCRLEDFPQNTDWDSLPDQEFRLVFREFIERNYPEQYRYMPRRVRWHEVRDWNKRLAEIGWIAPSWPSKWGGMELSPAKQIIYIDELERWGVGRAPDQGVRQLGPALMHYGTEAQQQAYLPKVLSCEHIWCQGYSEPNAGSDLASVTTSAVLEGDAIVINGRKIWTSMAMDCTHIYVLCRTDKTVKKQEGISFVILDLQTPGITIRPILDIAGNEEFCEITFDNVRTGIENLVGGLNKGWSVAKSVLDFERLGISSPWRPQIAFSRLTKLGAKLDLFEDQGFSDRYTELRLDLLDQATLYSQFAELARRGKNLGADVSILKIWGMEAFQRVTEFALEAAGSHGAKAGSFSIAGEQIDLLTPYYMARLITIGGGSNEIQRNIVSRHVLELPN